MNVILEWELDGDPSGKVKLTKDGRYYRLTLVVRGEAGTEPLMRVRGFRVNRGLTYVLPPTTTTAKGTFSVAELSAAYGRQILGEMNGGSYGAGKAGKSGRD